MDISLDYENSYRAGVYIIVRRVDGKNDKYYVGSSINMWKRRQSHLSCLRNGKHPNKYLQRSFQKYGEDAFEFNVLEFVDDLDMVIDREQYWIDEIKPFGENGYNLSPTAGSCAGFKTSEETKEKLSILFSGSNNPFYGKHHSNETKIRMSANHCDVTGEKNPFFGKTHTAKTKEKIREVNTGRPASEKVIKRLKEARGENSFANKLTEIEVLEIKEHLLNGKFLKEIARIYGVTDACISAIRGGITWTHVTGGKINSPSTSIVKINKEIADEIRFRHNAGESRKTLAREFDLDEAYLGKIIRFERWK